LYVIVSLTAEMGFTASHLSHLSRHYYSAHVSLSLSLSLSLSVFLSVEINFLDVAREPLSP